MPLLHLPWFLDLDTGYLVRKHTAVEVIGPGPTSSLFSVQGPTGAIAVPDVVDRLDADPPDETVMALHTLAVAQRAVRLLEQLTGTQAQWYYRNLPIYLRTHSQPVPQANAFYGVYTQGGSSIHFNYVEGDPPLSCALAHDLVVHEVCHAFLDGSRNWYRQDLETMALTEALGDLLAMYSIGRFAEARERALEETGGELSHTPNILSCFAEMPFLGVTLRDISQPVTRAYALAQIDIDIPYALATMLSSAIYEAMCRSLRDITGGHPDPVFLKGMLDHVAVSTFSTIECLDAAWQVRLDEFATAMLSQVGDPFGVHLRDCLVEQQVVQT